MSKAIKLVVVGNGAVGKTCLLVIYAKGTFPTEYIPTVFENYKTKVTVDGAEYFVQLWDTAGQEELENVRVLSYPNTDCFILCFSIPDHASFDDCKTKWFEEVKTQHGAGDPIYMVVGTKSDLRNSSTTSVTAQEGKALAQQIGAFAYVECSAFLNENVQEVFDKAINQVLNPGGGGGCCCVQ
jgi:small GTP-binding protein